MESQQELTAVFGEPAFAPPPQSGEADELARRKTLLGGAILSSAMSSYVNNRMKG